MAWVQELYDTLYDPNTICVACISHGKDSNAMLRAIKLLGLPLHRIVTSDVWATQDIPADLPPMWEWKKEADQTIKDLYGIEVEHICAMQKPSQNVQVERERERESTERGANATIPCSTPQCVSVESMQEISKDFLQRSVSGARSSNLKKLTYESLFYQRYEGGERNGKMYGFPFKNGSWCQSRLKPSVTENSFLTAPRMRGAK